MWPDYRVRQRDYMLEIYRALASQLDLTEVLRLILEAAVEMLAGQAGLIALSADDEGFKVSTAYGIRPEVLHYFKPLLTDIPKADSGDFAIPQLDRKVRLVARAAGLGFYQSVALPMVIGKELIGVVYVFRARGSHFTRSERRLLQSFADQAAIATHNARLYSQVVSEKRRLDAILQYSADGVFILDANHIFTTFNYALGSMTGWQPADAIDKNHDEVIRWARREPGMNLSEAEAGGWPLNSRSSLYVEGDLQKPDGNTVSVGITYAPLMDREGRLANIIGNVRDITKFREAEQAKSTFISIVSHELKTPVSLIKGYASTLRREDASWDEATIRDSLQVIEEEADRLTDLIENLLEATRLQSGMLGLDKKGHVHLDRLAERLAIKFKHQSDIHTVLTDFPPDFPPIEGDEIRLRQVLTNLLGNAIKYSPDGGEIRIRGSFDDKEVTLAVSDEGVGLAPDEASRVFERFYRVDDTLTRKTPGVGLGLFIARSIVEGHGGRIWAEGEVEQGATFLFTIPRI